MFELDNFVIENFKELCDTKCFEIIDSATFID